MAPLNNYQKGIIKTLSYADVFDYPLKLSEVYKYYIGKRASEEKIYSNLLDLISLGIISKSREFVFLNGRKKISVLRRSREKESIKKWEIAKTCAKLLSNIPTVLLVGVSGSLSMNNADKNDDIDLFIITSSNTLWLTRLFVNLFLLARRVKRSKYSLKHENKICVNMFVSEDALKINENLYSAHEIAQLKVLVNKKNSYEKFLVENEWVKNFLPHAISYLSPQPYPLGRGSKGEGQKKSNLFKISLWFTSVVITFDKLFYKLQYSYMKKSITTEKVSSKYAFFHPQDKTEFSQILYKQRHQSYVKNLNKKSNFSLKKYTFHRAKLLQDIDIN